MVDHAPHSRGRRIAALDRPLIVLAVVAVLLYLADLFRLIPAWLRLPAFWASFAIDTVFLVDLLAKCFLLRLDYLKSPWFVIDLLSTLPIVGSAIEAFALVGPHLRFMSAVRIARVARLSRTSRLVSITRVARLARALRVSRGLQFLRVLPSAMQRTPAFDRALRLGVPAILAGFVGLAFYLERVELESTTTELRRQVASARTVEELEQVQARLGPVAKNAPLPSLLELTREIGGRRVALSLSLEPALRRSDRFQGLLVLFVLFLVGVVVYIGQSLSRDRRKNEEVALLEQCFSPPIVDKFLTAPEVLSRYYQQWMSVFFLDVRGFTAATQKHAHDLEGLALRLRQVMDIARQEIVITFEGVVDKFMGDAVMGWIGGHFSKHWAIVAPLRKELLFEGLESAANDLQTLARELSSGGGDGAPGPAAPHRDAGELRDALEEARVRLARLEREQQEHLAASPDLRRRLDEAEARYRRSVARAAVLCMLRISERVSSQPGEDAFRELKIGLASGPICVGNFGSTLQVGFTILGPTVNRAARLEPASYQCGCRVLVDRETRDSVGDDGEVLFRRWGGIEVKGIEGELEVFEPLRATDENRALVERFHAGRELADRGELEGALEALRRADEVRVGGDPASRSLSTLLREALDAGRRSLGAYHATKG
jgi:class 3 adenylate cyclase